MAIYDTACCLGTTSAYAENTSRGMLPKSHSGNYLRVRGEYIATHTRGGSCGELPPRTRRIQALETSVLLSLGTTSAYAENTIQPGFQVKFPWNYLRVRGEYFDIIKGDPWFAELPPRTRRIQNFFAKAGAWLGTTSAYAENTLNELGLL